LNRDLCGVFLELKAKKEEIGRKNGNKWEEKRKEVGRRGGKDGEGLELKKRNEMWKNCNVKREGKENRGKKS
jgi:hypothetical protein